MDQNEFRCETCGSPHVSIPSILTPESQVLCGRCSRPVATWEDYREALCLAVCNETAHRRAALAPIPPLR